MGEGVVLNILMMKKFVNKIVERKGLLRDEVVSLFYFLKLIIAAVKVTIMNINGNKGLFINSLVNLFV